MLAIENYHKAQSIGDACTLLADNTDARIIAGGTDVLIRLREGKTGFSHLVDIMSVPELQQIHLNDDGILIIGSCVTFSRLIRFLQEHQICTALTEGASALGGPQVRNMATVGGNICNGAPSADSAAPLLTLDAELNIQSSRGSRQVAVEDIYLGPGNIELAADEIVTGIVIKPENYRSHGSYFYKYAMRRSMDIATIGCAASCQLDDNRIKSMKLAYTVAAPVPKRCRTAEKVVTGQPVTTALIRDIAGTVLTGLNPRNSWRAAKDFREHIIRTLAERVVTEAIQRAGGKFES